MVDKEIILEVVNHILGEKEFTGKCGNKPGYKSPQQKLKEFLARKNDFKQETYSKNQDPNNEEDDDYWESPRGKLQVIQSDLYQDRIDWTEKDIGVAMRWNTDLFTQINDYLYKKEGWEEAVYDMDFDSNGDMFYNHHKPNKYLVEADPYLDNEDNEYYMTIPQISDHLSEVIGKSRVYDGLQEDTCFFSYRHCDENIQVGDIGKFDGFLSLTYNPHVAEKEIPQMGWIGDNRRLMRVWVDKGTRGVVMDENLCGVDWQSEFLIDKGHKWICFGDDGEYVDIYIYD